MRNIKFIIAIVGFLSIQLNAQEVENKNFDSIFKNWEDDSKPGVVGCAIKDGKIVFLKAFGSADVENKKKNTIQTKFQVDDFAKQFTVLALLILEEKGTISLEDDIRKYLPELPEYKTPIRIKHLLNHTSGLHNLDPIKQLLGFRMNAIFTQQDALKLIGSQKELNFIPGTDFSYYQSDTEIILLAEIVAKSSGKSFIEFTTENVFKPLGMLNTIFNNDRSLLENTAKSYLIGEEIKHNPINDLTLGATNLYTTAEDLAKWYLNYDTSITKIGRLVKKLDTHVSLDNGKTHNSSWGEMAFGRYFDHPERGLPKKWQFGIMGGYSNSIFRFYTENYTFFVIGNNNRHNGMPSMDMAYQVLKDDFPKTPSVNYSKIGVKKLSVKKLKKHEGFYWMHKSGLARQVYVENDTLRYKRLGSTAGTALVPLSDTKFQFVIDGNDEPIIMKFKDNSYSFISGINDDAIIYNKYEPIKPTNSELEIYKGLYYNKELDAIFTFATNKNGLVAKNLKMNEIQIYPVFKDVFRTNTLMLSGFKFVRKENTILGFNITTDGMKNLFFEKLK